MSTHSSTSPLLSSQDDSEVPRRSSPQVSVAWSEAARSALSESRLRPLFSRRAKRAVLLCLSQAPPQHLYLVERWPRFQNSAIVDISFVCDEEIARLNKEYRNKPRPTDVLSFAQWENAHEMEWPIEANSNEFVLGDIIIAVETTERQAIEHGHEAADEAAFLAVHGALHLLGYDHADDSSRRLMWKWQNQMLDELKKSRRKRSSVSLASSF
jgi:probable rRNA maturation factor